MRYRQINDFERMLVETGTVVLKFMLHISPEEQRQRLQARIDDPTKAWKFVAHDLDVRRQWQAYRKAYERSWAPPAPPSLPGPSSPRIPRPIAT